MGRAPIGALFHAGHLLPVAGPGAAPLAGYSAGVDTMAQFTVNAPRFDPYKNFRFRVRWDGRYVAGLSKASGLQSTAEVARRRD